MHVGRQFENESNVDLLTTKQELLSKRNEILRFVRFENVFSLKKCNSFGLTRRSVVLLRAQDFF